MERYPAAPVRVLRVITRLNIGGPSIQATRLTTDLRGRGFETLLVHGQVGRNEGDMQYLLPESGVAVRYLPTLGRPIAPWADLRAMAALFAIMRRFRPQILHTHMAKAGLLGRMAAIVYNAIHPRSRIVMVHTYHGHVLEGYFPRPITTVFMQLERMLGRASARLVAVSSRVCDELVGRYRIAPREKFIVVPLGLDLDPFAAIDDRARAAARQALGIAPRAVVITTAGRLTAIKQQTLFLEMAQQVAAGIAESVFLVAGDGELRLALEAEARERGLADRVRFLGWRRDLTTLYAATDVFALTSRNEGTPVALIEAMASGVPGVATDVGGVRDVIIDASCGVVVPFGDATALADGVRAILGAPPDARERMRAAARAVVLSRFRLARLADDIAALYRDLLAESEGRDSFRGGLKP